MTEPISPAPAAGAASQTNDLDSVIATARRAADWSATADQLKNSVSRARLTAFALSIVGAAAATIAGQISAAQSARLIFAAVGAVALAVAAFISGRFLRADEVTQWVRARAAAEALKREAFRFATSAAPYSDAATASDLLDDQRAKIDADLSDVLQVAATRKGGAPRERLTPEAYRASRVRGQIDGFYIPKAAEARKRAKILRTAEFVLALLAVIITAASTVTGKTTVPFTAIQFDLAAFTALLTTIGASIIAHIESSRFDYIAASYAAAARRLEDEDARFNRAVPHDFSGFVNHCEDIIAAENQSWIAKWTRPTDAKSGGSAEPMQK